MNGFPNQPKILKGAFIEYGLSIPPLFVAFQFNPVELQRNRPPNNEVNCPTGKSTTAEKPLTLRQYHQENYLKEIQENQQVKVEEETISFDIRVDATDKLNEGNFVAQQFGIAPELAALEQMVYPKEESVLGPVIGPLLGFISGFSFSKKINPPMILFIWGRKRVLPVNITSMNIKETEFSTDLNPVRAEVSVSLTVIEGKNIPYTHTRVMKEAMASLNMLNITNIANVVIPG
jgi:hypothetical protein